MAKIAEVIARALNRPKDAVFYDLSQSLHEALPDKYRLETEDSAFDPNAFALEGKCEHRGHSDVVSTLTASYDTRRHEIYRSVYLGWNTYTWNEQEFDVVSASIQGIHCRDERQYLIANDEASANAFFLEVCRFNSEVHDEILVFSNGSWDKDPDLHKSIKSSNFDNIVLAGSLLEQIIADFESFFASEEVFRRYSLPWKRGALFLGPPGNGKTHMIKALANHLGKPVLYVKSFKHPYDTEHNCIQRAFSRARASAPCIFVLEDLDSLVTDDNRSFFLNEMDGFAANDGILTLATANYPERLDPAILERPSRFDRKYTFALPDESTRLRYLLDFSSRLESELRLSEDQAARVAKMTRGYSFAYLKELYVSTMMAWISSDTPRPKVLQLMESQVTTLLAQQQSAPTNLTDEPNFDPMAMIRMARTMSKKR